MGAACGVHAKNKCKESSVRALRSRNTFHLQNIAWNPQPDFPIGTAVLASRVAGKPKRKFDQICFLEVCSFRPPRSESLLTQGECRHSWSLRDTSGPPPPSLPGLRYCQSRFCTRCPEDSPSSPHGPFRIAPPCPLTQASPLGRHGQP